MILFAGGHGALGLKAPPTMKWGKGNFLVRTRDQFAAHIHGRGDRRAVRRQDGMNAIFRMGKAHADDIDAVAGYLKKQAAVPVWVVGTSMGTFSAARGAIGTKDVDGLVLTSSITRSRSRTGRSRQAIRMPLPACRCRRSPYRRW